MLLIIVIIIIIIIFFTRKETMIQSTNMKLPTLPYYRPKFWYNHMTPLPFNNPTRFRNYGILYPEIYEHLYDIQYPLFAYY